MCVTSHISQTHLRQTHISCMIMSMNKSQPTKINSIQALRGIACLFVILTHIEFIGVGAFGVELFFCISGFIMMYSTQKKEQPHFLLKRLIRIIPLYYFITTITLLAILFVPSMFQEVHFEWSYFFKSLCFIPFDITGQYTIQPLMRIGWTVNYEILFYLIFGCAMKINHQHRGIITSIFIIALSFLHKTISLANIPLYFYTNPIILEFMIGILIYYIYQFTKNKKDYFLSHSYLSILFIILIVSSFIYLCTIGVHAEIYETQRVIHWGIPCAIIFLSSLLLEFYYQPPRFLIQLGNISFSVYLMHYYIIQFIGRKIFDFSTLSTSSFVGAILGILISLLVGYVTWYCIEKKFTKYISTHILK